MKWWNELAPTAMGKAGKAWRVDMSLVVHDRPGTQATVSLWLVNVPGAHPARSWWMVYVIHLRPLEGTPPAEFHRPDSTHELVIMSLDPRHDPPNPRDGQGFLSGIRYLTPLDLVHQFHVGTDQQADEVCDLVVRACCDGQMSPDQDFRSAWRAVIDGTAAHVRDGLHGRAV